MRILVSIILLTMVVFVSFTHLVYAETAGEYLQKGISYEHEEKFDEALSEYQKAVSLYPKYNDALYNMGMIYFRKERWEEAVDAFRKIIELNPSDGEAHYHLAIAYLGLERYKDAVRHYDKAREFNFAGVPEFGERIEHYRYKEIDFKYNPLLDKNREEVIIMIKGNPLGENKLIEDVIRSLESFEYVSKNGMFKQIDIDLIKQEGTNAWSEKWIVKRDNSENKYMVKFKTNPAEGTDFVIEEIKE